MQNNPVYIVHCIDTEGPLYESIDATFERLRDIFHLDLEASPELLGRLQNGEVKLHGLESAVQRVLDPHLLAYNDTWDKVDGMLAEMLSSGFRNELLDSFGGGWVYNWFCVDHVDYDVNPRRRSMGYHSIFEHYEQTVRLSHGAQDGLHFHYHPHSFRREAHRCATHWWASSDSLHQNPFPTSHRSSVVSRCESPWLSCHPARQPLVSGAVHSIRFRKSGHAGCPHRWGTERPYGRTVR